ncbi:type II toxin-antitoxin system HicB family antitoxin [Patulibacter defluvii]|uniref:type II toxin-antitoxin system HicB family antitoxin n=1 Tax=Patulibacter defluvii TaxID=3095358 RepID=UPI002A750555|nr:type II toxin-antitoxin system HicB family antitoxin [Patulibacter sp. DM4]
MSMIETTPKTTVGTVPVLVLLHQADDGGWWAYSPHVPGVFAHGGSVEAAVEDWHSAVRFTREEPGELRIVDVDVIDDAHDAVAFTRIPAIGPDGR